MNSTLSKVLVLVLIFVGEAFAIYAEMYAAKNYATSRNINSIILYGSLMVFVAGTLLISGYVLGLQSFKNIWIVSAISITSIIIIEPALAWSFFHQIPTKGAIIGFVCGIIGLLSALFI